MLATTLITNMAFVACVKRPSFQAQYLDSFECANSTLHFYILLSGHIYALAILHVTQKGAICDTPLVRVL